MPVPKEILELVANFDQHVEEYRKGGLNEAQLRISFLNPFLKALGWDVDNAQNFAEAYREVIHEDAVKVGGNTKAPDYSCRIGGTRKFFVEAKKPSVVIKDEPAPAFQLRRYAWSAKLPLSILTDFEEFAVYDCRIRPSQNDKAATARIHYFKYDEYPDKWDEIAAIFSKEAVLKGSFDKYATTARGKKGTAEVDTAFLDEIEGWREALAKEIARNNEKLSQRALNWSVQQTIDRIIFLRIAEDRGIEPYGQLQALQNGTHVYARLKELFQKADDRYNSGLFHFKKEPDRLEEPDWITPGLVIEDKTLKDIFRHLYYPDSPYEFSVLGADILGSVYERFLGKVIRLTAGHHAKIEEKPEVKKAGGVYYTPTYIVQYIVQHTVGKLLEGKTPKEAEKLRILDPACGSGSFLIGAYQYLMDWYRDWYVKDGADKHTKGKSPKLHQGRGGIWRLTTAERKRILVNNIYGVDIDSQAVEVTKLSLLLKVLEGETQLEMFHERVLPDLGSNIKCGNSLIGPEFYQTQLILLDDGELQRINAFDWSDEFPAIMQAGGFDAVIGNPPYIRIQVMKEWAPDEVEFYKSQYLAASKGNYDIYVVFVEKGLSLLNKTGRLGFILPHKFFNAQYGEPLRLLISQGKHLAEVVHFGDQQVFDGATTYTCLLFLDKAGVSNFTYRKVDDLKLWRDSGAAESGPISSGKVSSSEWTFSLGKAAELFEHLNRVPTRLKDVASRIFQGIIPGADKVYAVKLLADDGKVSRCYSRALEKEVLLESALLRKIVSGPEVDRYILHDSDFRVIYPYVRAGQDANLIGPSELKSNYPKTFAYFENTRELLNARDRGSAKGPTWYRFIRTQNIALQPERKIAVPRLVSRLHAAYDEQGEYCLDNVDVGGIILENDKVDYHYLLALLNSKLLNFFFTKNAVPFRGGFFSANRQYIENIPIYLPERGAREEIGKQYKILDLSMVIAGMYKQLNTASSPPEQESLKRQIDATDRQIDKLVYELYGLTDEEIKIVEGAN